MAGLVIWLTNLVLFTVWYWELDRGGPLASKEGLPPVLPDFLFPQMTDERYAAPGWKPRFQDYLYVSLTNQTAFSPTDTMPLTRRAQAADGDSGPRFARHRRHHRGAGGEHPDGLTPGRARWSIIPTDFTRGGDAMDSGRASGAGQLRALVTFALLIGALVALLPSAASAAGVVPTDKGPVRGTETAAVKEYLGIPYAAPPVGNLRWRAPRPHPRWQSPLDATHFANHCPQQGSSIGGATTNEDCLYLNVYAPNRGNGKGHTKDLPVMFWIHGGALSGGESDDYDPTRLVDQGRVVVTINYRLGWLGFLAHPALTAESPNHASGDYGFMDQQAALRWVKRNIAKFGGDPGNVTIFGQSAGGHSVHVLLASPLAAGLFQRAIAHSGAYADNMPSLSQAETAGSDIADTGSAARIRPRSACGRSRSRTSFRHSRRVDSRSCRPSMASCCGRVPGRPSRAESSTASRSWRGPTTTSSGPTPRC